MGKLNRWNLLKVNVKSCTLGPKNPSALHRMQGIWNNSRRYEKDLFVVEHIIIWGVDAIVRHRATVLAPEPGGHTQSALSFSVEFSARTILRGPSQGTSKEARPPEERRQSHQA